MSYREIIAVCSQIHTEHINTLCGQNVKFVNVRAAGIYSSVYLNFWVGREEMCLGMAGRKKNKKARKKKNNFYGRNKKLNRKYERRVII